MPTINELPAGTTLAGTEKLPIWQGSATVAITIDDIAASLPGGGTVTQVAVNAPNILNSGSITSSGTITGATLTAARLLGNPGTAAGTATQIPVGGAASFNAGGSLVVGYGSLVVSGTPFLNNGTVGNGDTITAATLAAVSLVGNPGTAGAIPAAIPVSGNLAFSGGGLVGSYGSFVANATPFLNAGTIGNGNTLTAATLAAVSLIGNAGTAGAVPAAIPVSGNLAFSGGSLVGSYGSLVVSASPFLNAGTVGNGQSITAATLAAFSVIGVIGTAAAVPAAIPLGADFVNSGGTVQVAEKLHYDPLEFSLVGKPSASQIFQIMMTEAGTLVANSGGAQGRIITNPTSTMAFPLATVSSGTVTTAGTISVATSGTITWPSFSEIVLAPGNSIQITAPGTQDATGADMVFALRYRRT